jgi:Icc-related predicted phosphoesterase
MASRRVRRVLCAAEPGGSESAIEGLVETAEARDAQAIALVGDLSGDHPGREAYRSIFRALGAGGVPAFWVPGPHDAPVADYLRETANIEVVYPFLHGIHGTIGFGPGYVLFAGLGGAVEDDPDASRDEIGRLRYPRWEVEYRLKPLRELKDYVLVLLFHTPPAHKGQGTSGSEVLAELVATYRPRLAVCGGERGTTMLGRTLVIAPGRLSDGQYAVVDLRTHQVELEELAVAAH